MKTQQVDTPMLTVAEVAELLHSHPSTIYRMLKNGRIPGAVGIGSDWRINVEHVIRARTT